MASENIKQTTLEPWEKPVDYKKAYQDRIALNIQLLERDIYTPEYQKKIHNWAQKYNVDADIVMDKIINDPLFALNFIIEPSKQNLYEKVAAAHLSQLPNIQNFVNLPSTGENALVLLSGIVIPYPKALNASKRVKSIDFTWEVPTKNEIIKVYATHKHTQGKGGAQTNQETDVSLFMQEASHCTDNNIFFLSILDGDFYTHSKINSLNRNYGRNNVFALGIDDVYHFINNIQNQ